MGEAHRLPGRRSLSVTPSNLSAEWRSYFLRVLDHAPSRWSPRRFLQDDLLRTMRRFIPADARVFEAGVGSGELLAGLPNTVRHGIDCLPEAVEHACARDP